jgi:hypothetical protein
MKNRNRLLKIIGFLTLLGFLLFISAMFIPYPSGLFHKPAGDVLLRYFGLVKDKRSGSELARALESPEIEAQYDAVLALAYGGGSPENAEVLIRFIQTGTTSTGMKNFSVWALGEMRAREARAFLLTLKERDNIDRIEIDKAIKKIDNRVPKPFWRK